MNANASDVDLAAWLASNYDRVRQLPDGSFAALSGLMFTTGVYLGVSRWGFERRYCYEDAELAHAAFDALKCEDDEPEGWIARRPERPEDIAAKARAGYNGGRPSYTCPKCRQVSFNPNDVTERFCGACGAWERDTA